VNVREAFHWSNVPSMVTDAFTWNVIVLSPGVIWNTGTAGGACAPTGGVHRPHAARHTSTTWTRTACFAACMACLTGGNPPWRREWFAVVLGVQVWSTGSPAPSGCTRTAYHPTAQPTTSSSSLLRITGSMSRMAWLSSMKSERRVL
jgi:hypothetical protein